MKPAVTLVATQVDLQNHAIQDSQQMLQPAASHVTQVMQASLLLETRITASFPSAASTPLGARALNQIRVQLAVHVSNQTHAVATKDVTGLQKSHSVHRVLLATQVTRASLLLETRITASFPSAALTLLGARAMSVQRETLKTGDLTAATA